MRQLTAKLGGAPGSVWPSEGVGPGGDEVGPVPGLDRGRSVRVGEHCSDIPTECDHPLAGKPADLGSQSFLLSVLSVQCHSQT